MKIDRARVEYLFLFGIEQLNGRRGGGGWERQGARGGVGEEVRGSRGVFEREGRRLLGMRRGLREDTK